VTPPRFDVLVVGAGPGGSIAATVLARGGARVALLDKAAFPRDKACGDLIGPRGVQVLVDLGLPLPDGPRLGPMVVVGPTGRQVRLPSAAGLTYPGYGVAATRADFDARLQRAAAEAGAFPVTARADEPLWSQRRLEGFRARGTDLRADFVIGADGATSRVAHVAGLVRPERVLWGFAVRGYHAEPVEAPTIALLETGPWRAFPGYGWVFPGAEGGANVGIGIATGPARPAGSGAVRAFPAFLGHLRRLGLWDPAGSRLPFRRLGGWLKMGMVGTNPASGRVLLAGDAAGLINPLQGEGIAPAMCSGQWAAEAILGYGGAAAARYRARLAAAHLPYHRITAALQQALVGRPRAAAVLARSLTACGQIEPMAGGWAVFWNELLDGAPGGSHRTVAAVATRMGALLTAFTPAARWFAGDPVSRPDQPRTCTELTYQAPGVGETESS
jgi:geranylgeranyl reductase family protein